MKRRFNTSWTGPGIVLVILFFFLSAITASPPDADDDGDHARGEILIRLKGTIPLPRILSANGILQALPAGISRTRIAPSRDDLFLLRLGECPKETETRVMHLLLAHPGVSAVSFNFRRRPARRPDDPLYHRQWSLSNSGLNAPLVPGTKGADIDAESAWNAGTGNTQSVVAVVDSGIDYLHPDLAPNMWRNPQEEPGNGYDDDGNGYVDDVHGYDFAADRFGANRPDPMDEDGHGTHIAGIIGARGNNGIGVSGINWACRLLAVGVVRPDGFYYLDDELEAFEYIRRLKISGAANIVAVNCSFGGSQYSAVEEEAFRELVQAGIIVAAAAGNGGDDDTGDDNDETLFYPASYPVEGVISIAATDSGDQLAEFSNYGALEVDIAAPGDGIFSTVIRGQGRLAQVRGEGKAWNALGLEFSGTTAGIRGTPIPCGQGLTLADFPADVRDGVALVERGVSQFSEKVRLATAAGAAAVVIYNNELGNFNGTLQSAGEWIPVVSISRQDGLELLEHREPFVTVINRADDYDYKSGTSMATPHVAGALALLASRYPREVPYRRLTRLLLSGKSLDHLAQRIATGSRLDLGGMTIPPPLSLRAVRRRNDSLMQTEYVTHISWQAAPVNSHRPVTGYLIFMTRPTFRILGRVGSEGREFLQRRVSRDSLLEYGVVALDDSGNRGNPAFAAVKDD